MDFKTIRRAAFRYMIYGTLLVAGEVAFYTIIKIGRSLPDWGNWFFAFGWRVDPRLDLGQIWEVPINTLYGQASLWMFFVYASICLFGLENAYEHIRKWPWFLRGTIYMLVILSMECLTGWLLLWGTGWEIWYYDDPLTVLRFTSFAIGPMWFVVGLISENFMHIVDKLTRTKAQLAEIHGRSGDTN